MFQIYSYIASSLGESFLKSVIVTCCLRTHMAIVYAPNFLKVLYTVAGNPQ